MKEQLTKEKILKDYEKTAKNKKTMIGISSLAVLGIGILLYGIYVDQAIAKVLTICMAIVLIIAPFWTAVYTFLTLKALKQGRYQVVIDHVKKVTYPRFGGKYQTPGYLIFRKNGEIIANNRFMIDPNDDAETQRFEYWKNAQVGDPFYLVMVKKKIIHIYSPEHYDLPQELNQ